MTEPVTIPLLNPNEPEALLTGLPIIEGQHITAGDLLCTLETTKSTSDVYAEKDGYVVGLRFQVGDMVQAGTTLCYLADTPDWISPVAAYGEQVETNSPIPDGLRISKPALAFAQEMGIDLRSLPIGPMITKSTLEGMDIIEGPFEATDGDFDPNALVIYGGGGHGKTVIELVRALGTYQIIGVIDDGMEMGDSILGVPILGNSEILAKLYDQGIRLALNAVGGIGNLPIRVKVFERIRKAGFVCPAVVHPAAFIEPSAKISAGSQIFPHAYVGSDSRVGFGSIINTGAIISHDCILEDHVNLSPGAILAGQVHVGTRVLIGMGVTINLGVQIGANTRIGNGATVKRDVPAKSIVPAGGNWPE